jgi:hypothetical protein
MATEKEQNYKNHAMFDPWFHGVLFAGGLIGLAQAGYLMYHQPTCLTGFLVLSMLLFFVLMFKTRIYAMKVQDRVIRLEERLRLQAILPEALKTRIPELTTDQLIGLRFAGDNEVAALVEQALKNNWTRKEIKLAVKNWRADFHRV